jgi:hypothetical protein
MKRDHRSSNAPVTKLALAWLHRVFITRVQHSSVSKVTVGWTAGYESRRGCHRASLPLGTRDPHWRYRHDTVQPSWGIHVEHSAPKNVLTEVIKISFLALMVFSWWLELCKSTRTQRRFTFADNCLHTCNANIARFSDTIWRFGICFALKVTEYFIHQLSGLPV